MTYPFIKFTIKMIDQWNSTELSTTAWVNIVRLLLNIINPWNYLLDIFTTHIKKDVKLYIIYNWQWSPIGKDKGVML